MNTHPIPASELIITPRGSIYHLDLRPEELARTIITVGDPDRVAKVSQYFDTMEYQRAHREFVTHTGFIGDKRISVVSTGIGPDNIDIVLNELDALANIDFNTRMVRDQHTSLNIIRLGTSGSLQENIPVDSFVVSSHAIGLDNLMHYYEMHHHNHTEEQHILHEFIKHIGLEQSPINPYIFEGAISLKNHFIEGFHHGITVTCPGFYAPQGRILRQPLAFPNLIDQLSTFDYNNKLNITNFEMETAAIYGLSRLMGHHSLSISAIVANRQNKTFSADGNLAVKQLIEQALPIIAAL